jgi:hypothetical protein
MLYVIFEIFMMVTMKKVVFWDVVLTDVSEECIASIFRVEGKIRKSVERERGSVARLGQV